MRSIIDRWNSSSAVLLGIINILRLARRLGITSGEDGWRRTTRAYFRTEHSKWTLAIMGLSIPPGEKATTAVDPFEAQAFLYRVWPERRLAVYLRCSIEFP